MFDSAKIVMSGSLEKTRKEGYCLFHASNTLLPPVYLPCTAISPEYGIVGNVSFDLELVPSLNSYKQPCFLFRLKSVFSFDKKKF